MKAITIIIIFFTWSINVHANLVYEDPNIKKEAIKTAKIIAKGTPEEFETITDTLPCGPRLWERASDLPVLSESVGDMKIHKVILNHDWVRVGDTYVHGRLLQNKEEREELLSFIQKDLRSGFSVRGLEKKEMFEWVSLWGQMAEQPHILIESTDLSKKYIVGITPEGKIWFIEDFSDLPDIPQKKPTSR